MCPCFLLDGQIEKWNELCSMHALIFIICIRIRIIVVTNLYSNKNYSSIDGCTFYNLPMCPCFVLDRQIEKWNELCSIGNKDICNYFHNFLSKIYRWAFLVHDISKLKAYRYNFYLNLLKCLIMCPFGFN